MTFFFFARQASNFKAGRLAAFLPTWSKITSDPEILHMVSGQRIEFSSEPVHITQPNKGVFSDKERSVITSEINALLEKAVIVKGHHEPGEFISPIFVSPQKDGSHRMIFNLKNLNKHVEYNHFKMDTLESAICLMTPGCYMASIDLKEAYYSVPIAKDHQKYLKFEWGHTLYQFTCSPNRLAFCPRKFTKLLKPIYSVLRRQGHISSPYIDDSYLQGSDFEDCVANIIATIQLFISLGFIIHPTKSILIPTQKLIFLGFVLDSVLMRVYLTPEKSRKVISVCSDLYHSKCFTIRAVSRVIGYIISSFPGVMHGPLYFRQLEREKTLALKCHQGNFDSTTTLSEASRAELKWWIDSTESSYNVVHHGQPEITLKTDASKKGWGCFLDPVSTGGLWTD